MENDKQINHICAIHRGLGIVEGVAMGVGNEPVAQMLYTAAEMIDEAVEELLKDGK